MPKELLSREKSSPITYRLCGEGGIPYCSKAVVYCWVLGDLNTGWHRNGFC